MKILASGDHHFDEHSRFEECVRVHDWIADQVAEQRPDVFLSGGDLYERSSTPVERKAVAAWLKRVASVCPVIIAKGNHDRSLDPSIMVDLETKYPVIVEEAARVHYVGGAAIAVVAWPNKASVAAMIGRPISSDGLDDVTREALRNVLSGLGQELAAHQGPRILLMHAMVNGSVTSTGQPMIGGELALGLEDLGLAGPALTVLAHIHKPQAWTWNGAPVAYTGSPFRTAFGELEEKSILSAEFGRGGTLLGWERIATPATPMIHIEGQYVETHVGLPGDVIVPAGIFLDGQHDVTGAEVRFRYLVETDHRDAAKAEAAKRRAEMLAAGAKSVKVEEMVIASTRARAPEIAEAKTIADKLEAFWASKNIRLREDRKDRVLSRLTQLQGEVQS